MIRFIIKRSMGDRCVPLTRVSLETFDVDVPELEAALNGGGYNNHGDFDHRELVGVEVLPAQPVDLCHNCDTPAPGCDGLFASEGKPCRFHGL